MATAFPHATVAVWATDEHRIGLKPLLKRVWTLPGQRPLAPVEPRYDWRYLVAFVHPASGRTIWHLATGEGGERFSAELAAFAAAVGASPTKQIVLVLDQAGWHTGHDVAVPEHVHLILGTVSVATSARLPERPNDLARSCGARREQELLHRRRAGRRWRKAPRPPQHDC